MSRRGRRWTIVVLAGALVLAQCGGDPDPPTEGVRHQVSALGKIDDRDVGKAHRADEMRDPILPVGLGTVRVSMETRRRQGLHLRHALLVCFQDFPGAIVHGP